MSNFSTKDALTDALCDFFYDDLTKTEDFSIFESIVAGDMDRLRADAFRKCLERFDCELCKNIPRNWKKHEHAKRKIITLLGVVTFKRTIFLDEYGRHRALLDELLGIPARSRLSPCAFIWIATKASELSYRKTAFDFEKFTNTSISHITVMNVVHKEGELLKKSGAEFMRDSKQKISQDTLFLESDGLWVHTQTEKHRSKALPRFLYEQARKTVSFELKIAALYAGKKEVSPGRFVRGGLCLTCLDDTTDNFWERVWKMLCENYDQDDLYHLNVGADGASWCGSERIENKVSAKCKVEFTLDLFHIMQKLVKAFPDEESSEQQLAINLLMRGRAHELVSMCKHTLDKMPSNKTKRKVKDLYVYLNSHINSIRKPTHTMGTMEGTNAHVGAARLKGHGRSWSRRGAEAMCLIRCALLTGRKLIAPSASSWFSKKELEAKEKAMPRSATDIPKTTGSGYELPHFAAPLPKRVNIALKCNG